MNQLLKIYNLKEHLEYLEEVATLEYLEWADNPSDNSQIRIQKKIDKMKNQLNKNEICKLILLDQSKLIGFISIFPHDCQELPHLSPWYSTMYIKKEYRGNHYSKVLNDAIIKEAKKQKIQKLYLKTELINYYEKFDAEYLGKINQTEHLYRFNLNS